MSSSQPTAALRAALLALALLSSACYSYLPLEPAQLQPGASVRMRISAAEAERVEPLLGRTDARLLTGRLISHSPDAFLVEVPTTSQVSPGQALHQRIAIPRSSLLEVEGRTLNRTRTTLATGAATVGIVAILLKSRVIGPGKSGPPGGGGPPVLRHWHR